MNQRNYLSQNIIKIKPLSNKEILCQPNSDTPREPSSIMADDTFVSNYNPN